MFCSEHRYSDRHDCSYDYKAAGREAIARENPVVRAAKILKGSQNAKYLSSERRYFSSDGMHTASTSILSHRFNFDYAPPRLFVFLFCFLPVRSKTKNTKNNDLGLERDASAYLFVFQFLTPW
ncbi:hypothetical protein L2E82_30725 [Cichorium intybus]|uniref:Uncharacterized protein n=1 Tax=Cichorium intybus TaxID=13427 RepID=A0ACB9D153_CICIN|nr:hypothetical protein L2E82_30725 [Cichorium intybus]